MSNYIETQQNKEDYEKYLNKFPNMEREFSSYYKQIKLVHDNLKWWNILEIGPWTWFTSSYLKILWYKVDTFDYFEKFNPTYCWDIREIDKIVNKKYDLVICFEVLEHIPFEEFIPTLNKFFKLSNKVIISLPNAEFNFFTFLYRFPYMIDPKKIYFSLSMFFKEHKYNWEHFWEIWKKWYSKRKIINLLKKEFYLKKVDYPLLHNKHIFFNLDKK